MKTFNKILAVLLCAVMIVTVAPLSRFKAEAVNVESGNCGANLKWVLDDKGTLTISGTGNMSYWASVSSVPWYDFLKSIKYVVLKSGVTNIEHAAFLNCTELKTVNIPDTVTEIRNYAFSNCSSLTSVTIPDSVTEILSDAFSDCVSLKTLKLPNNITEIRQRVFANCSSLTSITIPDSVTKIYSDAFDKCTSLTSVTIPDSVTNIYSYAFDKCTSIKNVYYSGSESDWNNINIDYGNECLTSARVYFNNTSGSPFIYSQTRMVDNNKNSSYENNYFSGIATALDGEGSYPNLCIPGLSEKDNLVPQGITYYEAKNWLLISADSKNANTASVIMALDKSTGEYVAEFEVYKDDKPFDGHVGGIAASSENLYISNNKSISYIPLEEFNVQPGTSKVVKIVATSKALNLNGANVSYLSYSDSVLYAGNFYSDSNDGYDTPASSSNNSVVLGYKLSGKNEWSNFEKIVSKPDYCFYVPDYIDKIQGAAVKDNNLYISASHGRDKDSKLYVVNISNKNTHSFEYADLEYFALPMMEGIAFADNDLYAIFESAAYFYREKDWYDKSKDPTDVVWKIDTTKTNLYNFGEENYKFKNFKDFDSKIGHCFGMSITSSGYYTGALDVRSLGINSPDKLSTLSRSITVKKNICYYQSLQSKSLIRKCLVAADEIMDTPYNIQSDWDAVVGYVKEHKYDNKGTLQVTTACEISNQSVAGHAVNFLYFSNVNGQDRIYVYDSNYPDKETYYYKDSNGKVVHSQGEYNIVSIALMDISKYLVDSRDFSLIHFIYTYVGEVSIAGLECYPMYGLDSEEPIYIYEIPDDIDTVVIKPLVDNAEFTYLGKEYSFNNIDNDTVGVLKLAESEDDSSESFKVTDVGSVYDLSICTPSVTSVNYGETLVLHADLGGMQLPEGYTVEWIATGNGASIKGSEDGMTCNVNCVASGEVTVTARIVKETEDGKTTESVLNADGEEIKFEQNLVMKAGFFQKLISFFKNLFRIPRVILQSI